MCFNWIFLDVIKCLIFLIEFIFFKFFKNIFKLRIDDIVEVWILVRFFSLFKVWLLILLIVKLISCLLIFGFII